MPKPTDIVEMKAALMTIGLWNDLPQEIHRKWNRNISHQTLITELLQLVDILNNPFK